jgi:hypothetical protein
LDHTGVAKELRRVKRMVLSGHKEPLYDVQNTTKNLKKGHMRRWLFLIFNYEIEKNPCVTTWSETVLPYDRPLL